MFNNKDLPDDFWQSIRHVSSFANIDLYNVYLEIKIKEWKSLNNG